MRPLIPVLVFLVCLCSPAVADAQSLQKTVSDAYLITKMVEKYHVQPRPLDDTFSAAMYARLLESLDDQQIFFNREDLARLSPYRLQLDNEILEKRSGFLQLLTGIYKQRLFQADTIIDHITARPVTFNSREMLTAAELNNPPENIAGMRTKLYKILKHSMLEVIMEYASMAGKTPSGAFADSLEPILRKRVKTNVKRAIRRMLQSPIGIEAMIGNVYCQVIASSFDPHTAYFPPDEKNAFESQLGNKPVAFGLTLTEDEEGNPQIGRLIPGSSAFQSGMLNEGDRIQSIQWEGKEPIDVSGAGLEELNNMLSAEGGSKATLTVKKADGSIKQVVLSKTRLNMDDDEDKVQGFLLKGSRTIGYIALPAFYSDWENNSGLNGCANDVARQILKLKKENISGLILDLRYNGGGNMKEAVELAGIFIDAGPVAQVRGKAAKVITLKDINRGTVYDGPLVLLVNGLSASASEMVAGTLQDYNRALIVGSPTYGKATTQVILPMDTTIDLDTYDGHKEASSYIKVTIEKLYRLNGSTAQLSGVIPDIRLPDPPNTLSEREADEKMALPPTAIDANKYYMRLPPLPVAALQQAAKKEMDSSVFFREAVKYNGKKETLTRDKDIPLNLEEAWKAAAGRPHASSPELPAAERRDPFTDAYVQMAYKLLFEMIK